MQQNSTYRPYLPDDPSYSKEVQVASEYRYARGDGHVQCPALELYWGSLGKQNFMQLLLPRIWKFITIYLLLADWPGKSIVSIHFGLLNWDGGKLCTITTS